MTLQQLHYVITITEMGSFNNAQEVLYVAQPSLTGAVQELEKELGIVIFNRTRKGITLTNDGIEFINHARQLYQQYEIILDKYGKGATLKKKFGISTQHYSFAVKSFVEMVKKFNTTEYEFAIRETKTREVIEDVSTSKSEIGILYLSDFNRKIITKLLKTNNLEFHKLIDSSSKISMSSFPKSSPSLSKTTGSPPCSKPSSACLSNFRRICRLPMTECRYQKSESHHTMAGFGFCFLACTGL